MMPEQITVRVTEQEIAAWERSVLTDVHDAAAEIRRLQARERQILEQGNRALELRRTAEQTVAIRDIQIEALERWIRALLETGRAGAYVVRECEHGVVGLPCGLCAELEAAGVILEPRWRTI